MPKLKCEAESCAYNCDRRCCKSMIYVCDNKKVRVDDAICKSYHKRKKEKDYLTEFANFDGLNQYVSIDCDVINCIYNCHRLCVSEKVEINNASENKSLSVKCKTMDISSK